MELALPALVAARAGAHAHDKSSCNQESEGGPFLFVISSSIIAHISRRHTRVNCTFRSLFQPVPMRPAVPSDAKASAKTAWSFSSQEESQASMLKGRSQQIASQGDLAEGSIITSQFQPFRNLSFDGRKTLRRPRKSISIEHTSGRFFAEARPVAETTYFPASSASTAVVIALYNEDAPALSRTLESLASAGVALDVVVVADGLSKISDSMRRFLRRTFNLDRAVLQPESYLWVLANRQTFVSDPVTMGSSGSRFSVLLKRFNHKKINTVRTRRVMRRVALAFSPLLSAASAHGIEPSTTPGHDTRPWAQHEAQHEAQHAARLLSASTRAPTCADPSSSHVSSTSGSSERTAQIRVAPSR